MSHGILEDSVYQKFVHNKKDSLNKNTLKKYNQIIGHFTYVVDKSFQDIVNTALEEQDNDNYNPNSPEASIYKDISTYLNSFKDGNKNKSVNDNSIKTNITVIRGVLDNLGVELPYLEPFKDENEIELSKKELAYIIESCNIRQKSLLTFLLSSQIPLDICLNLTLNDFMKATHNYHKCNDVEDFINNFINKKEGWIGTWKYYDEDGLKIAFNSQESGTYILQELHNRKESGNLNRDEIIYLFPSKNYKSHYSKESLKALFKSKTKLLRTIRVKEYYSSFEFDACCSSDFDYNFEKELDNKMKNRKSKFGVVSLKKYYSNILHKHCNEKIFYDLLEHETVYSDNKINIHKLKKYYENMCDDLNINLTVIKSENDVTSILNEYFEEHNFRDDNFHDVYRRELANLFGKDLYSKGYFFKELVNDYMDYVDFVIDFQDFKLIKENVCEEIKINEIEFEDLYLYPAEIKELFYDTCWGLTISSESLDSVVNLSLNLLQFECLCNSFDNLRLNDNGFITITAYIVYQTRNKGLIDLKELLDLLFKLCGHFIFRHDLYSSLSHGNKELVKKYENVSFSDFY